jgi:uncharacterized protein YneR
LGHPRNLGAHHIKGKQVLETLHEMDVDINDQEQWYFDNLDMDVISITTNDTL